MRKLFLVPIIALMAAFSVYAQPSDDFECGGVDCGSNWVTDWSFTGGCEVSGLTNPNGNFHLRGDNGCDANREFDSTGGDGSTNISFSALASGLENGEFCNYYYYDGAVQNQLLSLGNGDDDSIHKVYSYEVSQMGTSTNAQIRMEQVGGTGDTCAIDDVSITLVASSPPANLIIESEDLQCDAECIFKITAIHPSSESVTISKLEWFLYVPFLQIPHLETTNIGTVLQSSPTGVDNYITVDMELEFGGNNYPRNQLIVTAQNAAMQETSNKSNIFSIVLDQEIGSIDVFGTEYVPGEPGTVFVEVVNDQGLAVNDASCLLNIWSPLDVNSSHEQFLTTAPMLQLDANNGIYYYDLTVPSVVGVYMMSASCSYESLNVWVYDLDSQSGRSPTRTAVTGSYDGSTLFLNGFGDFVYTRCNSANAAGQKCDAEYDFNLSTFNLENLTDLSLFYAGESTTASTVNFSVWNQTDSTWIYLPNILTFSGLATTDGPRGVSDFASNIIPTIDTVSNDSIVRIRALGEGGSAFTQYDNWLNMKISSVGVSPQVLKGSGEIHVSDALYRVNSSIQQEFTDQHNNILAQIATVAQQVWDYTLGRYINGEIP